MVETDYTSLFGGEVVDQPADDLVLGTWRTVLTPLDATHHLLGPITVELRGESAIADCHVRAVHVCARAKSGAEWTVAGHYVFTLTSTAAGWKIRKMKLETSYQTGNTQLLKEAAGA
jgi:3-phenylpropionate/cinnamic acid dioxygenase small subunit